MNKERTGLSTGLYTGVDNSAANEELFSVFAQVEVLEKDIFLLTVVEPTALLDPWRGDLSPFYHQCVTSFVTGLSHNKNTCFGRGAPN